ncbi:MAG: FGGY-family carbohydrate kinase [Desulfosudaceae bacterium]
MTPDRKYILAIDHGTSGIKAALVSTHGQVVDFEFRATATSYLDNGGVEQDPEEWWRAILEAAARLARRQTVPRRAIAAVSVSSTFSSTVAVDRNGNPLMNAITWMDTRGGPYVKKAMAGFPSYKGYGLATALKWIARTGGAPTMSGKDDIGHVLFIKHQHPDIYDRTHLFLPSKDFLNFKLTGLPAGTVDSMHLFWVTDIRDINRVVYDDSLIAGFGLDQAKLPPLLLSTDILGKVTGTVAEKLGLVAGTPVIAGSPDHQTACIGSGAVNDYQGHVYIGTSSWVQCPVPFKKTDLLHSVASFPTAMPGKYQAVNEQDMAGEALDLIRHLLAGGHDRAEDEEVVSYDQLTAMAARAPAGSRDLIFTPWLNGERTPVDDETIRGGLFNMKTTTSRADVIRAVMEGVAYNNRWSLTYVEKFIKRRLSPLNMIGGGARSGLWCQIFADVLDREIRQVKDPMQANARGAAFIAAVGLGEITFEDIPGLIEYSGHFTPNPAHRDTYDRLQAAFIRLYRAHKKICRTLNQRDLSS